MPGPQLHVVWGSAILLPAPEPGCWPQGSAVGRWPGWPEGLMQPRGSRSSRRLPRAAWLEALRAPLQGGYAGRRWLTTGYGNESEMALPEVPACPRSAGSVPHLPHGRSWGTRWCPGAAAPPVCQRVKQCELWNGCGEDGQVYFARTLVQNYTSEGKPAAEGSNRQRKHRNTMGLAWLCSQPEENSTESKHHGSESRCSLQGVK